MALWMTDETPKVETKLETKETGKKGGEATAPPSSIHPIIDADEEFARA